MVRKCKPVLLLTLCLLVLQSSGCPKDPYTASLKASDDVSNAVHSAIKVATQYYSTGKLTDSEKAAVAGYLNTVTDANMTFRHNVVAAHTAGAVGNTQYLQIAQAFVNAVPTDPLAFQYKSADAQKEFTTVLGAIKTLLNGISLTISNAKGA